MKLYQSSLQTLLILLPTYAIHSGRRMPLLGIEALRSRSTDKVVQQSGELFLLCYPAPSGARRLTPGTRALRSRSVACGLDVVLLGLRPSLRWLRGSATFSVRQLHRYYGVVRLLQNVHARMMGLSPSRTVLSRRRSGGLPVLVHTAC